MNKQAKLFYAGALVSIYVVLGILINCEYIESSFWINQLCTWTGPIGFFLIGTESEEQSTGNGVFGAFLIGLYVAFMIMSPHLIEIPEEYLEQFNYYLYGILGMVVLVFAPIAGGLCLGIYCSEL